ncbi:MAG: LOG family protein [Bacteroidota bacterium]|nr:LOG family protein [Bacteroidota bacterium]
MTKIITIFGSSSVSKDSFEYNNAYELGKLLSNAGFTVCNGGYGGIMEASAKGAKSVGGKTIGVVSDFFSKIPNKFIDETVVADSLLSRLQKLVEPGDAYVVFRGATGTLVELAIVWEYIIKGVMKEKPIIVFSNYWDSVIQTITNELTNEGLEDFTKFVTQVDSAKECVAVLRSKLG